MGVDGMDLDQTAQQIVYWITCSVEENYELIIRWVNKLFWMSIQKQKFVDATCSELVVFMYWARNSMNNLMTYCGLVAARISVSDKDLPVQKLVIQRAPSPLYHALEQLSIPFNKLP